MPETYTLRLQNFRSIRDVTLEIAPLTVIYGPNGSGKSSILYGLQTLRNFLTNPNQNLPSIFSYPSVSLGGWTEVIHNHRADRSLSLSIGVSNAGLLSPEFALTLEQSGGLARIGFGGFDLEVAGSWPRCLDLPIALPYRGNQDAGCEFELLLDPSISGILPETPPRKLFGEAHWNGYVFSALPGNPSSQDTGFFEQVNRTANLPMELARECGFVPLRRGFSKPNYALTPVTPALANEDEVASALALPDGRYRMYEVSRYIERIADRRIQTQAQIGTSIFTIDSIPIGPGVPVPIVNEGFGINQLLYMLFICLYPPFKIVGIEEPEIHLHPSMVRKLAPVLAEIATNEDRRLIVSTHSEVFVVALLSNIAAGKIDAADVSFILAENQGGETRLTQRYATSDGQIEGGLKPFMASELEDLAAFLGIDS